MSNEIDIFQYLSLVRYKGLSKIIKNITKKKISIILDFEDSSKDIFSPKNTLILKSKCRDGFKYLNSLNVKYPNIYLRINGLKSKFFKEDLICLKKNLNKGFKVKGIFVPKIEKYDDLKIINKLLDLENKKIKLIPMIESKKGFLNVDNILSMDKKKLICAVHYGHFDYCLSKRIWPFPEPYHKEYWDMVFEIINACIKYKKKFIQTPFPIINNPKLFYKSISYIKSKFIDLDLSLTLVNYDKRFFNKSYIFGDKLIIKKISTDKEYKIKFAKKIMNTYINTKKSKKSFSLSEKRFIPPHQYLAAKYFLNKNEKK